MDGVLAFFFSCLLFFHLTLYKNQFINLKYLTSTTNDQSFFAIDLAFIRCLFIILFTPGTSLIYFIFILLINRLIMATHEDKCYQIYVLRLSCFCYLSNLSTIMLGVNKNNKTSLECIFVLLFFRMKFQLLKLLFNQKLCLYQLLSPIHRHNCLNERIYKSPFFCLVA